MKWKVFKYSVLAALLIGLLSVGLKVGISDQPVAVSKVIINLETAR
jgi:hypothetical protein